MGKKYYKVAEIASNGDHFLVSYAGPIPEQGGMAFGWGQVKVSSLESALTFIRDKVDLEKVYRVIGEKNE